MRVAVNVEQLLYRAPGGTGRYTAKLVSLLSDAGSDLTVIPFTARHRAEETDEAYRSFGLSSRVPPPVRLALPRPLLYDAWHSVGGPPLEWLARDRRLRHLDLIHAPSLAVPPKGKARLVVNAHDAGPILSPESSTTRGRRFHRQGLRAAARRADLVITGSHAAAAEIVEHTPIPAGRIRVVPNGVDVTAASPADVDATRRRWDLDTVPYVLWVGSLEPRKNVGLLVRAFADATDQAGLAHRLVLAGPAGWLDSDLIAPGDRTRLGDRLRLLGRVAEAELAALYAGAALFAFPSRHEGFGFPVLEAMAQGTPVVCSDIPALREVAGGAARLVAPGDTAAWTRAIAAMLGDWSGRDEMVAAGRRRAAEMTWEKTVVATREVYAEALS